MGAPVRQRKTKTLDDFMSGGYTEASADIIGSGGFREWTTDMPYTKKFSSGGYVTRPTVGLVGEAGEDEYIIPASKMAASMQRYSAGAYAPFGVLGPRLACAQQQRRELLLRARAELCVLRFGGLQK